MPVRRAPAEMPDEASQLEEAEARTVPAGMVSGISTRPAFTPRYPYLCPLATF
ncbi:MAG TPA: hypothetical protein VG675_05945 [Bryobacteraceae bacterium]|nr:hypothetical protein [Bryobacteraceae bacterium]